MIFMKNCEKFGLLLTAFLIVLLFGCSTEISEECKMKSMVPTFAAGWKLQTEAETYDRQTIFDYINGAGEVYLAYGFQEVEIFYQY